MRQDWPRWVTAQYFGVLAFSYFLFFIAHRFTINVVSIVLLTLQQLYFIVINQKRHAISFIRTPSHKASIWRQGTSWCNYFVISIKDEIYFYKRFFTRTFVRFLYLINIFIIYAGLTFGRMKFPFFNFNITEF